MISRFLLIWWSMLITMKERSIRLEKTREELQLLLYLRVFNIQLHCHRIDTTTVESKKVLST